MERVLLTAENIKDADEFVDGEGDVCVRRANGFWSWGGDIDAVASDARIMEREWPYMRGAYVTRWKPGREPKAPSATKWVKGYVTQAGDNLGDGPAPIGTVLSDGAVIQTVSCTVHFFPAGWVVVREAPQPPAKEPWRRVVVEVRGKGHDARVRIVGDRDGAGLYADAIAAYATPAPDRAKVREMLDGYACGRVTEDAFLDYVCGPAPKDGDA